MPPTLTKAEVAAGALAIINEHGPNRVTARALGSELHVAPATLYTVFDSLGSVDTATRELLLQQLEPMLREVAAAGHLAPFWAWARHARHAALFLTDPTSPHLEMAKQLFPTVANIDQAADLQAIVHSVLAASATMDETGRNLEQTAGVLTQLYLDTTASGTASTLKLPDLPASPSLTEISDKRIGAGNESERAMAVRRIGVNLIVSEGLDGWAFRRVVEESGVPLTTLHRLGDRKSHLRQAFADLSDAAWQRAALADADVASQIGLTVRELNNAGVASLMGLLRQPVAVGDALGPLVAIDLLAGSGNETHSLIPSHALLRAIASVVVSRFARADDAPEAWAEVAEFSAALVAHWLE